MTKEQQKNIAYEAVIKALINGIKDKSITDLNTVIGVLEYTLNAQKGE